MSKTIELQIEKSQVLIEGLNRNICELRAKGVRDESLTAMSKCSVYCHNALHATESQERLWNTHTSYLCDEQLLCKCFTFFL